jgi:hypothetical protein
MRKILLAVFIILSCHSHAQNTEPNIDSLMKLMDGQGEIPPDFSSSKTILIVFKDAKNSINKYLEKALENEYTGEYRLLEQGEYISPKDTANARYFIMVMPKFVPGHFTAGGREGPETDYQMWMTDRVTKKVYYSKNTSSCFSCLFKDYFKKLEKIRAK